MKLRSVKSIVCLAVALSIIIGTVQMTLVSFAALSAETPTLKSTVGEVLFKDTSVIDTTLGENYSTFKINGTLPDEAYDSANDIIYVARDTYDYLEFDIFIENYDKFMRSLKYDASGKKLDVPNTLMFNLSPLSDYSLGVRCYQWWHLEEQLTGSGWNHIIINLYNNAGCNIMQPFTAGPAGAAENKYYSLFVGSDNGLTYVTNLYRTVSPVEKTSDTETGMKGDEIGIANISLTRVAAPMLDLSEYGMVAELGNGFLEANITPDPKDGNINKTYNDINSNSKLKSNISPIADCGDAEYVEFDMFTEGPKALREVFNKDNVKWMFALTDINGNTAAAQFIDKLNCGWNHVRLARSEFAGEDFDWNAVASYKFVFEGDGLGNEFVERHQEVSVANIYATGTKGIKFRTPENKTENPLLTVFRKSSLGVNENSSFGDCAQSLSALNLENVDLSNNDYIAFDMHISDISLYENSAAGAVPQLWLSSGNSEKKNSVSAEFEKYRQAGEDSNWYHYLIPKNDFKQLNGKTDWSKINSCGIRFSDSAKKVGSAYSLELTYINVGGNTVGSPVDSFIGSAKSTLLDGEKSVYYTKNGFEVGASELSEDNIQTNDYLETDIYIENFERFKTAVDAGAHLTLILENEAGQTRTWALGGFIANSGWNHIAAKRSSGSTNTFNANKKITSWKIYSDNLPADTNIENCLVKIGRLAVTEVKEIAENNKWNKQSTLTNIGKNGHLGQKFSSTLLQSNLTAADFSKAMFVEFDFYVQNYTLLKNAMESKEINAVNLTLTDTSKVTYTADIWPLVKKSGWNHLEVPIASFTISKGESTKQITGWKLSFAGKTSNVNPAAKTAWAVMNICATGVDIPAPTCDNTILKMFGSDAAGGSFGEKLTLNVNSSLEEAVDVSKADMIEFDLYIPDYKSFREAFKFNGDGTALDRSVQFGLSNSEKFSGAGYGTWENWAWQVKKDGWNHIQLDAKNPNSSANWDEASKEIHSWQLVCSGTPITDNTVAFDNCIIANIAAVAMKIPEAPTNKLNTFGSPKGSSLGYWFHDTQNRVFENRLKAVDFSGVSSIEFDIYINGYEELAAATAGTWRDEKIALKLSSTYSSLWNKYNYPHHMFSGEAVFNDQITHNGWNHIKLGPVEFYNVYTGQALDFSRLTGWCISYQSASNVHAEMNPASDVYIYVANLSACGYKSNIPADSEKAVANDPNGVYISSCESVSDTHGAWNSVDIDTKYKNEGKASVGLSVNYLTKAFEVQPTYILDETADMSDLSVLKLDIFTDFPQFMGKNGNNAEIILSSDRFAKNNYYSWKIDFTKISEGWNTLELRIENAVKVGNPDISEIKMFMLRYNSLNLDADMFEGFYFAIDNIRYISKTGNKTLKINGSSDIGDDVINTGKTDDIGTVDIPDNILPDVTEPDEISSPGTKYLKTIKNIIKTDYLVYGIVIGAEALVLAVAFVIIVLVRKKKSKKI